MTAPTSEQPESRPTVRSATAWSYGLTLGKMGITTGLALVLAAMLGPRAFGVIAMALVFTNFIEMVQQQGMMPAVIARKSLRDAHADTAFWLVVGVGIACTTIGLVVAPWWANLNDLPELTSVIQVLALCVPLSSSVVVHEAILRRNLQFKKLAIRSWVSVLAGGAAGITAAIMGWGVWALVTQQLVMNVTVVLVLWTVSRWRPRLRFSRTAARELLSYSWRSASSSLGLFLGGRLDVILAGAFFGPVLVGLYKMGHRLTTMTVDVTARSMQAVSLPSLAKVQDNSDAFADQLVRMQRFTSYLALPTLGVLAGIAPVVEHVLGDDWSDTTIAIRLLAISQALAAMTLLLGPALQARGRPGTLAIVLWIWSGLTAIAIVVAAAVDLPDDDMALTALCLAIVTATTVSSSVLAITAARCLHIPVLRILGASAPAVVAGGAAAMVGMATEAAWKDGYTFLTAVVSGLLAFLTALAILSALDPVIRAGLRHPSSLVDRFRNERPTVVELPEEDVGISSRTSLSRTDGAGN